MAKATAIMDETEQAAEIRESGATRVLSDIGRAKFWIIGWTLLCVILAAIYLRGATYLYTARITIVPAQGQDGQLGGKLGGLASVAGVSLGGGEPVDPLDLYIEQLKSRSVAAQLTRDEALMHHVFAGEWDGQRWRAPRGAMIGLAQSTKRLMGLPIYPWEKPSAERMQNYLATRITVKEQTNKPIVAVSIDDRDPRFALTLITDLHRAADNIVRQAALAKATRHIDYLKATLPTVTVVEQRAALSGLLSEQEKTKMLASSSAPYAVELIDTPYVSSRPTQPKPLLILLGALFVGLATSVGAVLIRMQLKNR